MNGDPGTPTIARLHKMSRISHSPSRVRLGCFALDGKTKHGFSEKHRAKILRENENCKYAPSAQAALTFGATLFHNPQRGGPSVLLTLLLPRTETTYSMARFSAFLGRSVEVQYRAGDILLPASGIFVADSGRSIFLEQNFEQRGQHKHFRWEIPYQYLVRIQEKPDSGATINTTSTSPKSTPESEAPVASKSAEEPRSAAAAAGGAPGILPLSHRPKTA